MALEDRQKRLAELREKRRKLKEEVVGEITKNDEVELAAEISGPTTPSGPVDDESIPEYDRLMKDDTTLLRRMTDDSLARIRREQASQLGTEKNSP